MSGYLRGAELAKVRVILLSIGGLGLWLSAGRAIKDWHAQVPYLIVPLAAALIVLIPLARRTLSEILESARHPLQRARRFITVAVILAAAVYLTLTAHRQQRYLKPIWPDE